MSGDCTRILFGLINRLHDQGHSVQVASYGKAPHWMECRAPFQQVDCFSQALTNPDFDRVVVSNAHLIPMLLPLAQGRPVALLCQGYESYYYGETLTELRSECPALRRLKQLPVGLLACSRSVQRLLREEAGRESHLVPVAIERRPYSAHSPGEGPFRVLLAGAPRAPYKGLRDAFAALHLLAQSRPVQMVLLSPETRPSPVPDFSLPSQVHYLPSAACSAQVLSSCHAYCCSSWYEGHDLTTLEAMAAGLPVVSTANLGVDDIAQEDQNMLLVEPAQPEQLAQALLRLTEEVGLAERLRQGGYATVEGKYDWDTTLSEFLSALERIPGAPPVDEEQMRAFVDELEREGLYTPLPLYRLIQACTRELEQTRDAVTLQAVRERLKPALANPRSQYYAAARAVFDRASLGLAWPERR